MIVPSKNQKTYGVIHTENYFSFLGFCKKVNSDKIQKVDIFVDNILIDTIIADKHIEKIEDIYELEGFGFEYILPNEYIGQKSLISFKNHETQENLQNSPYELIDETHPKFNEMAFLNSINILDKERIKELYCPNTVGFLATEENLQDKEFMKYIKELMVRFPNVEFKGFYTKLVDIQNRENDLEFIQFIIVSDIKIVIQNIEFFLFNNYKVNLEIALFDFIRKYCINILALHSNFSIPNYKSLTIQEVEKYWEIPLIKFINNFYKLGFEECDISNDKSYTKSYSNILYRKFNLGKPITNLEQNAYEYFNFKNIEYALLNKEFKKFYFNMVIGQLNVLDEK